MATSDRLQRRVVDRGDAERRPHRWAAAGTVLALAATAVLEVTGMLTEQALGCSSPTN
ncbi:MAG: hypothetical protein WD080_10600 [Egibacteraceae bacterium]